MPDSDRRRGRASRGLKQAWELRASVTHKVFDFYDTRSFETGCSRTWLSGLYLEAIGQAAQALSPIERHQLEELLRSEDAGAQLASILRGIIKQQRAA